MHSWPSIVFSFMDNNGSHLSANICNRRKSGKRHLNVRHDGVFYVHLLITGLPNGCGAVVFVSSRRQRNLFSRHVFLHQWTFGRFVVFEN